MKNFIFDYCGDTYVTTMGTNCPAAVVLFNVAHKLDLPTDKSVYGQIDNISISKSIYGTIQLSGDVEIDGRKYHYDSTKEPMLEPIIEDDPIVTDRIYSNWQLREADALVAAYSGIQPSVPSPAPVVAPTDELELNPLVELDPLQSTYGLIDEWTEEHVDLSSIDDTFCIENNWHDFGNIYVIDNTKEMVRYFYSDTLNISKELPMEEVQRRRLNG